MEPYNFKLVLCRPTIDEAAADRLYGQCKDATLITDADQTYLDFEREATTLEQAMHSAVADVEVAGFAVSRVEVEPATLTA